METKPFTFSFTVPQTPQQVFNAINNIRGWWSEDFKGASLQAGDEFEVRFGDVHYSRHRLEELIPAEKIVWLVTDSRLNFLQHKTEWTGTKTAFDISAQDGETTVRFTHHGLVPERECFKDCSNGWTHYLRSLNDFITTGTGNPNVLKDEIAEKAKAVDTH